jgi:3-hydroxyisobutyrate dehydrogenase-like beta-hydroxyacid dehydrogenase
MLVLGGHGVLGTMIAEAAGAAGWTAIRSSRLDEADVIVSTVPDEQLVASAWRSATGACSSTSPRRRYHCR